LAKNQSGTQSIERTVELLRALGTRRNIGWRLTDLAAYCKLNHSTVHRIMTCLAQLRLVRQRAHDRRYVPGPMLYEFSLAMPAYSRLQMACHRNLTRVARKTGWTAFLYLRSDQESVCIDRVEGRAKHVSFNDIGSRHPLAGSAPGIAMLLVMAEKEQQALLQENWKQILKNAAHRNRAYTRMWQRSQQFGLGFNRGDIVDGMGSIGVAIRDSKGQPVAALGLSGPLIEWDEDRITETMAMLREEGLRMERENEALIAEISG